MYKYIQDISEGTVKALKMVLENAKWKTVQGPDTDFKTWHSPEIDIEELKEIWPTWSQVFFLSIPPGGRVHKHTDTPRPEKTYHIPVQTNPKSMNYMYTPKKCGYHLRVGKVYSVDRQIPHDSVNNGDTDRIHLLVEACT